METEQSSSQWSQAKDTLLFTGSAPGHTGTHSMVLQARKHGGHSDTSAMGS